VVSCFPCIHLVQDGKNPDIASWFGVENDDLLTLFPNIDNFDSIYNGNPLGLLI